MKNATFLSKFRAKFQEGLARKTGWGKNEIAQLFDACAAEALAEALDDVTPSSRPSELETAKRNVMAGACKARSKEEAIGIAITVGRNNYPQPEWGVSADAVLIPWEWLDEGRKS